MTRRQKPRGLLKERRSISQSAITTARIIARAGRRTEIAMSGVIRVEVLLVIVTTIGRAAMIVQRRRQRSSLTLGAEKAG
jgi:hypothetical protein